jgi:peptidoglycan hydrolase CwlO-like protein
MSFNIEEFKKSMNQIFDKVYDTPDAIIALAAKQAKLEKKELLLKEKELKRIKKEEERIRKEEEKTKKIEEKIGKLGYIIV